MPAMPIARPTSDSFKAGASFVPSPVTATMSPRFFSSCTSVNLSWGELRASTCRPCKGNGYNVASLSFLNDCI